MLGVRVVRGPNWQHGDQDGGPDHVGTVVGTSGNEVKVQWDMGLTSMCRAGPTDFDLRVFDSASIGVFHSDTACVACEDVGLYGTLWSCSQCDRVNLCAVCYHDDKHDVKHQFVRVDFSGAERLTVSRRSTSQRARSMGTFPNATVTRGPDWTYGNQDGGPGREGTVEDVVSYGQDSTDRNGARVRWANEQTQVYRLGHDGKVDVTCSEEAPGPTFYTEHLAVLDLSRFEMWQQNLIELGDLVCTEMSTEELKQLHPGSQWSNRFDEIIGEVGEVEGFTADGDVIIKYNDDSITLIRTAVIRVPNHQKGDKVKVRSSKVKVKRLQNKHGGWEDEIEQLLGEVGTVSAIDKDCDVGVVFPGGQAFVFHPCCLISLSQDGRTEDDESDDSDDVAVHGTGTGGGEGNGDDDDDDDDEDLGAGLIGMLAGLALLQALAQAERSGDSRQALINAIEENREADVRAILDKEPALKDFRPKDVPLLNVAAFKGFTGIVGALLDAGMNIDGVDEKGNSALMIAIIRDQCECAKFMIGRGANVNLTNHEGRTAVHVAAHKNAKDILILILQEGCNPNAQDVVGDTPLHDAISESHDDTAGILILHDEVNVWLQNSKNFNVMHMACIKNHAFAVDKLLTREPRLARTAKNDGFMPLHICAINNHVNAANILLVKGRADVNARALSQATPLILAASQAYFDMVELLLTYEADWTLKDKDGDTALHMCMTGRRTNEALLVLLGLRNFAEDVERVKIANFLYQHGASYDVKNNAGETPISACKIPHMRESVKEYAAKNKPTKPEPLRVRPKTAKVAKEVFTTAKQNCHKCTENEAVVVFKPCNHKVTCNSCCFKCKTCPVCSKTISKRVGKDGKVVTTGGCCIQ